MVKGLNNDFKDEYKLMKTEEMLEKKLKSSKQNKDAILEKLLFTQ